MNYKRLLYTLSYLKPTQLLFQVWYRLYQAELRKYTAPKHDVIRLKTESIPRYKCVEGDLFSFLNLSHKFSDWNFTENGMLWAYNQNYFDWLNQEGMTADEGSKWIDMFVCDLTTNKVGLDPYPTALRGINWIKFFCRFPKTATQEREDSLYSQYRLLEKKKEYHLLGNHLLEDAFSLYIGAHYFQDEGMKEKAHYLLEKQLCEQTLPDGGHYEQSPMYHCILLDRLLDCINITKEEWLSPFASQWLGWLNNICYHDRTFPMFNDSALGIAPSPQKLFDYAQRLGIKAQPCVLKESGYRKMRKNGIEAFVDIGNITATYQPGHTHADTLNYELRIEGKPIVVDTGISTYNKNERRQYERGTSAHNCVVADGRDSTEVWGGFRVGKRCKVTIEKEAPTEIVANHNGYPKRCRRKFELADNAFVVEDWYEGDAISYIHLAEDVEVERVKIEGARVVETIDGDYSTEYNRYHKGKILRIHFNGHLRYCIQ